MALVHHVTWIALPAHVGPSGKHRLSAFASLRLEPSSPTDLSTLGDFSPDVQQWATSVHGKSFTAEFATNLVVPLTPLSTPEPSLWTALFPPDTPVGEWAFVDQETKAKHTFPLRQILAFIQQLYGETASQADTGFPWFDDPESPLGRLRPLRPIVSMTPNTESFVNEAQSKNPSGVVENTEYSDASAQAFGSAHRFYYRPWYRAKSTPDDPDDPPQTPAYSPEFHERLSLLGDFPHLLRALGLVLDFEFTAPPNLPTEGTVRLLDADGSAAGPWTAYELDPGDSAFFTRPDLETFDIAWIRNGWMTLGEDLYDTYQLDADGAALKVTEFASHLGHLSKDELRGPTTVMHAALPTLRTGGWTIAQDARAEWLHQKFQQVADKHQKMKSSFDETVLFAEQLVRGWRLDVEDDGRWYSLHGRDVTHSFPSGAGTIAYSDEGFAKNSTVTSNPQLDENGTDPASDDLYVHEGILGWDGWSLSVPRPGGHLPADNDSTGATVSRYDDTAAELGMATALRVTEQSLPRLRFGRAYRFRARAVDLAGNSHPHRADYETDPEFQSPPRVYRRFEPVPSPLVVPRFDFTEGESGHHLVLRSNGDPGAPDEVSTSDYAVELNQTTGSTLYHATADRHVLAPRVDPHLAEQHGTFDSILDPSAPTTPAAAYQTAAREAAIVPERIPTAEAPLEYLPDPWASGVRFVAFDHAGKELGTLTHLYDLSTPDSATFRLEVVEGLSFTISIPAGQTRLVRIALPRAAHIRLEISSIFPDGATTLAKFAVWDWCDPKSAQLQAAAVGGRHWMLTPPRVLLLTHAVQQPFAHDIDLPARPPVPDSRALEARRRAGETFATFVGPIRCHAGSTGRIELVGTWDEAIDDPQEESWSKAPRTDVAFQFDIGPDENDAQVTLTDPERLDEQGADTFKRCVRCQTLVLASVNWHRNCPAAGRPVGSPPEPPDEYGAHLLIDAPVFGLKQRGGPASGDAWRVCWSCSSLVLDTGTAGPCPSGVANHVFSSTHYEIEPVQTGGRQIALHRCKKCSVLFDPSRSPRPCPAAGPHEPEGAALTLPRLDRVSRHEFGDTKHRTIVYHAVATSRFREFFPEEITADAKRLQREEPHDGRDAVPLTRIVPSSARPAAPEVDYIVPTFRWDDRSGRGIVARSRIGGGLRVYLRRPWFSSGDGEMLAVVLRKPGRLGLPTVVPEDEPVSDRLAPYVTDFGRDPAWEGASPPATPAFTHFPLATSADSDEPFPLDELDLSVLVAPHRVYWDGEQAVWYADVDIDVGEAYFPMIRLALARFQPHSVPGLHLSRVVQTDFIQTVPDRHAWFQLTRGGATIGLAGVIGRDLIGTPRNPAFRAAPTAVVQLQEKDPSLGDFGWSTLTEAPLRAHHQGVRADWRGSITLPPGAVGSGRHRLLFLEREAYPADTPLLHVTHMTATRSRIVYADAFTL